MEAPNPKVQHVTKASSDELLRKFAGINDDSDNDTVSSAASSAKRRKVSRKKQNNSSNENEDYEEINGGSLRVVERKSLLPHQRGARRSGSVFRHLAIYRSHHHHNHHHHLRGGGGRDSGRSKSVLGAIEKTWSKAVRGASKVFMEKHYNRHRLLISDMV